VANVLLAPKPLILLTSKLLIALVTSVIVIKLLSLVKCEVFVGTLKLTAPFLLEIVVCAPAVVVIVVTPASVT
jgi:hypothetical protein